MLIKLMFEWKHRGEILLTGQMSPPPLVSSIHQTLTSTGSKCYKKKKNQLINKSKTMSNLWILIGHNRNTILGHEHHCESKCRTRGIVGRWCSSSCCSHQTHRTRICWPDWYSCGRQELHFYSWKMKEHGGQFTSTQLENICSSESGLKTRYCSTSQFFVEDE